MKISSILFALLVLTVASCKQNKYATTGGKVESDDAYYQKGDTYISDFALVDDEARMGLPQDSTTSANNVDDYYTPDTTKSSTTNNYYGNVYQDPWANGGNYNNSGYGNYGYGSYSYMNRPSVSLGWSPWSGWYTSFNYGYNYGYGNGCGYNNYGYPGYGWYTPYYSPYCYNNWNSYNWYSPFNYYPSYGYGGGYGYPNYSGYGYGNGYANNDNNNNVVHGPRNPIAATTSTNSTYSNNVFYSDVKQQNVAQSVAPELVRPHDSPYTSNRLNAAESQPIAAGNKPQMERPITSIKTPNTSAAQSAPIVHQENLNNAQTSLHENDVNARNSGGTFKPRPTYTANQHGTTQPANKPSTMQSQSNRVNDNHNSWKKPAVEAPRNNYQPSRSTSTPNYTPSHSDHNSNPTHRSEPPKVHVPESRPVEHPSRNIQHDSAPTHSAPHVSPPHTGGGGGGGGGTISGPRRK